VNGARVLVVASEARWNDLRDALAAGRVDAELEYEVDADAAIHRVRGGGIACVLLDANTGDGNGLALVRALRDGELATPVVVLSGGDGAEAADVMSAGATDYLEWSRMSPARLARRMRSAVRLAHAEAEARLARTELAVERRLLREVLQQMPAGVVIASVPGGDVLLENDQVEELLGGPLTGDTGLVARDPRGAVIGASDWPLMRAIELGDVTVDQEIVCRHSDGAIVWLHARAAPVVDSDGQRVAAVMTLHDITPELIAQADAERAARARQDTLSVVSHDLRGPLNTIGIAAEEIAASTDGNAEVGRYVAAIERAAAKSERLIGDLLDVGRIDAGRLEIEPAPVFVASLLEGTVADHQVEAEDHEVALAIVDSDPQARVLADKHRIGQVLANLVRNAIAHTRRGGHIELSAREDGEHIRFEVLDDGAGVPADVLPHLFERYYHERGDGTGLGLAIAKGVVEAHGGAIGVDSTPGDGARFWFTLPVA